jgi:hypothetical protein
LASNSAANEWCAIAGTAAMAAINAAPAIEAILTFIVVTSP